MKHAKIAVALLVAALAASGCANSPIGRQRQLEGAAMGVAGTLAAGAIMAPRYNPAGTYSSGPLQYQQQGGYVQQSSRVIHVEGARHNPDGTCTQSNGRRGIDKNGMCFVPD